MAAVSKRNKKIQAAKSGIQARYDAAGNGRRMRNWVTSTSGPNTAIVGLQKIRDRARDISRNDWSGRSGLQKWATNLVGTGIVPRVTRAVSKELKKKLTDLWTEWVKVSDADGVLNFYGQQTLAVRAWLDGGEVFIRLRPRSIESGLVVPFQIQLVEAEFVPLLDADTWPGLPAGNRIRSGIELNKYGRRIAYWMYKEHPSDGQSTVTSSDLVRIPAEFVRHMFEPERPGQLRGVSAMAAVLTRLRNTGDFEDAVLERQKLANLFTMFVTRPANTYGDDGIDPLTGAAIETTDGQPMATLSPGTSQELAPGEDVKFANPPEAGTTYSDYMRTQHLGTAAGAGMPYEIFSGDIINVSDRTLRVLINEFRRFAEQRQWQIIIPMFCEPVRDMWAMQAVISGSISPDEFEDAKRVEWSPHGWSHIHPTQDPQGKLLEVNAGFRSRSSVIGDRGDDPDAVDEERAADKKREDALGLTPPPPAPAVAPAKPAAPAPAPTKKPTALEEAQVRALDAQTLVSLRVPAEVLPPTFNMAAPVVNVTLPTITVEPAAVTVENNVPAPIVTVTNTVDPTPVNVNVENNVPAPIVNVENNVPAAEVNVHLPTRQIDSVIKRDGKGNIASVTQTEKSVE